MASKPSPVERIQDAGRKLFFEHGFAGVTTDALVKEASVSKATLYKYFPSMTDVLRAVVEAEGDSFREGIPEHFTTQSEFREALVAFGTKLLTFLNRNDIIQFSQLMLEESRSHPDISKEFYASAYVRSLHALADVIRLGQEKGFLHNQLTSMELAEQLIGMFEGIRCVKSHLGLTKKPFQNPKQWADKCVQTLFGELQSHYRDTTSSPNG